MTTPPQPVDGIRCLDHDCRKRIPKGVYYCPYCGMPALQNVMPSPEASRQTVIIGVLMMACVGVFVVLYGQVSGLVAERFSTPTVIVTNTPTPTRTPIPTRTPFPKALRALESAQTITPTPTATTSPTPIPTPTNVTVRGFSSQPADTAIMGVVNSPFQMRTEPNYASPPVRSFTTGARLKVLGRQPDSSWVKVTTLDASDVGWIRAGLITLEDSWTVDVLPLAQD